MGQDDVYACDEVVAWALGGGDDFAIVRLDRPVVGHVPAPVTTSDARLEMDQPVWMIGFGSGLPAKLDDGGRVNDPGDETFPRRFGATVDAFGGNSGSGVFDDTGAVVGILVAGQRDYTDTGEGCRIVNVIDEDAGIGESIVYVHRAIEQLCASEHATARLCPPGTLGWCGICEIDADCREGFVCDADPRSSLRRCGSGCATDDDCRDGHTCVEGACNAQWAPACDGATPAVGSTCGELLPTGEACADDLRCAAGECIERLPGDGCFSAVPLEAVSQTLTGTLVGADGLTRGTCAGNGPEVVYEVELTEERYVVATATGFDTVLYVRADDCDAGDEVVCNDDHADVPRLGSYFAEVLDAGTYYLFVDAYSGDVDEFEVELDFLPACGARCRPGAVDCDADRTRPQECVTGLDGCPTWMRRPACGLAEICTDGECVELADGDRCTDAIAIEAVNQTIEGTLPRAAANDEEGSCAGVGREIVYSLHVDEPRRLVATASGFDTVLHLRRRHCAAADSEVACNDDDAGVGDLGSRIEAVLEPDRYYLFLDSYSSGESGDFTLDLEFGCAYDCVTGDRRCTDSGAEVCDAPIDGACPRWVVDTTCAPHEYCADGACADRVDGDVCATAIPVSVIADTTITGDLSAGARADYAGTCAGVGVDLVYALEVPTLTDVVATATGFDSVLYMRGAACDDDEPDAEIACNDDSDEVDGRGARITATLEPGTHHLFVDAFGESVGPFELSIAASRPCDAACSLGGLRCVGDGVHACLPGDDTCPTWMPAEACAPTDVCVGGACTPGDPGDVCEAPTRIEPGDQRLEGVVAGHFRDTTEASCGDVGLDRFFVFTLPATALVTATVVEAPVGTSVSIRAGDCGSTEAEVSCGTEEAFANLEPGEHFVVLDGVPRGSAYAIDLVFSVPCEHECAVGERRCDGDVVQWCTGPAPGGCAEWADLDVCLGGLRCDDGACIDDGPDSGDGGDVTEPVDAGPVDVGPPDTSDDADAGAVDVAPPDAGPIDVRPDRDADSGDAGTRDTDATLADAGPRDTSGVDGLADSQDGAAGPDLGDLGDAIGPRPTVIDAGGRIPHDAGCGCATTPVGGGGAWVGLVALIAMVRRRQPGS